ncbi:phage tail protein [Dialister hominis]|uniref:phage tail protein n=1 Tax=Dialister hominis TaxID=2582419 RepID=UPI00402972B2
MGLFGGHNTTIRENKISSFTVSTAEYGSTVPEILGTTRISPNVIYYDDFTAHEHRQSQKSGKGGGSRTTTITYTYTVAVILALCEGQISGIGKMWKDKSLYQYPNGDIGLTLFDGKADQKPWAYVAGKHPDKALAYPGLAYMAGVIDLGDGGSMPSYNFEVKGKLLETGDGIDVNPADYILYVLNKIGLGGIEIDGIENYRQYCKEADMLISTPSDKLDAKAAREIINDIANITNAYIFWSNNRLKIVPRADRPVGKWKPDKTIRYNLTPDDFIPQTGGVCVSYSRKDSSEIYNRISVEFLNRANAYEKEIVNYQDNDDIKDFGVRQASTTQAHYLYTKTRAVRLAEELCRKNKYERVKYTFKLDWAFCRLEPGDLVMLNDPLMGIENQPAMIDSATEGTNGIITFTAISRAKDVYSGAEYNVHYNERPLIDFNPDPGICEPPMIFQPPALMTSADNEVWIGIWGKNPNWGGCSVWGSDTNQYYKKLGTIDNRARYGALTKPLNREDTVLEMALNQDAFTSVDAGSAKNGDTVMYVDGEALSYQTAELLEGGTWRLSGLVRGQFGSEADYHVPGARIARCDETFLKSGLADSYIGKTVYFKFTAFNIFGGMEQSLADVQAYAFKPVSVQIPPPDVTALNAEKLANGIRRYWWKYTYPEPNDVAGFMLKYTQGKELNWDTGIPVQEGLITNQPYETQTVRPGTHAVMIKAVDQNGNESKNFAYCLLEMGDLLQENVLFDKDFGTDHWADIKTSGLVLASEGCIHAKNTSAMWHEAGMRLWTKLTAYMWDTAFVAYEVTGEFVAPASGQLWLTTEIEGPAIVYYRQLLKGSTAEELWKQWSDKVLVQASSTIQVKIVAKNSSIQETIVKGLHAYIDVPDRQEHFEDLYVPAAGIELPITTPNYMTTAVRIDAVQGSGVVMYPKILSRTPCRIALLNEGGNQVAGTADITWQGFVNETV